MSPCLLLFYVVLRYIRLQVLDNSQRLAGLRSFILPGNHVFLLYLPKPCVFLDCGACDLFLPLAWSYQKQVDNTIWTRLFLLLPGIPIQEVQHSYAFSVREIWLAPCIYCEGAVERNEEIGRSNGRGALKACGRYGRFSKDRRKDLQSQILIHFLLDRGVRLDWAPNFVCH